MVLTVFRSRLRDGCDLTMLEEIGRRRRQIDRFQIERRQDVAIGGIAGCRQRDAIAGVEACEEGERKAAR